MWFHCYRATTIYTTQTLVRRDPYSSPLIKVDVMLVGTNDGKILKIVMTYNGTAHVPLISEELSVSFIINYSFVSLLLTSGIAI